MFKFDFHKVSQYFDPSTSRMWMPVAKVGAGFILGGILIILLKELLIAILAAGLIGLGVFILSVAFRIWRSNRIKYY